MKIYKELSIADFEGWSGAEDTLDRIIAEDKCDELEAILEDMYPEGMDETSLNDLLRFEAETVFEWLGIRSESVIREELDEAREALHDLMEDYETIRDDDDYSESEKDEIWIDQYQDEAEELRDRIAELEEELKDI